MEDCIFCKIINGEIPSYKVYEDEHTYAFLDINPVNLGHVLVVPRNHSANLMEAEAADVHHVMDTSKKLMPAITEATGAPAFNVTFNVGPVAGQMVMHLHVHIVPRHEGDGLELWPGKELGKEEMSEVASKINDSVG